LKEWNFGAELTEADVVRRFIALGTTAIGSRATEASFLTQACYPGGVEQRAKDHK